MYNCNLVWLHFEGKRGGLLRVTVNIEEFRMTQPSIIPDYYVYYVVENKNNPKESSGVFRDDSIKLRR